MATELVLVTEKRYRKNAYDSLDIRVSLVGVFSSASPNAIPEEVSPYTVEKWHDALLMTSGNGRLRELDKDKEIADLAVKSLL